MTELQLLKNKYPAPFNSDLERACQDIIYATGHDPLVVKALEFACESHLGQLRKSGEPFIFHPLAVAWILIQDFGISDSSIISAAILHDVVEDVEGVSDQTIHDNFGKDVAAYVNGCTKLNVFRINPDENVDMTHSKLLKKASRRPEILLVKLADRLHNMRTIDAMSQKKQRLKAMETIQVYAPLAAKFNLVSIKRKLYDISIKTYFPQKYRGFKRHLREVENSGIENDIKFQLKKIYDNYSYPVEIRSRVKDVTTFYSPELNTLRREYAQSIIDFTIVLNSTDIQECYRALGAVNNIYRPVPKSIRDMVANPKMNGYRSLHVKVLYKDIKILFKVRLKSMDTASSRGFWQDREQYLHTRNAISGIGSYSGTPRDRKQLIQNMREDDEIFVYTPKNALHLLPQGSSVLDFACRIHRDLMTCCSHAVIRQEKVPPTHILNDGDTVLLKTAERTIELHSDLIRFCKTRRAKSVIEQLLRKKRDAYAIHLGRDMLSRTLSLNGLGSEVLPTTHVRYYLEFRGLGGINDLFKKVGQNLIPPGDFLYDVYDLKYNNADIPVTVASLDRGIHKFSKCCNPLPGTDGVMAILTPRGVSFHQKNCERLSRTRGFSKSLLYPVNWDLPASWETSMEFLIKVGQSSIMGGIPALGEFPENIHISKLVQKDRKSGTEFHIQLSLDNFKTARDIFQIFAKHGLAPAVLDFSQKGQAFMPF